MGYATLTIQTGVIQANIKRIKASLKPPTQTMLIVKANAYGLGATPICQSLEGHVDYFGVATLDEALQLRNHGITTPILLLSEPLESQFELICKQNIDITIYNKSTIEQLVLFTEKTKETVCTHLKIDTGLNRLGIPWQHAPDLLSYWQQTPHTILKKGILSHFANSRSPNHPLNQTQLSRFIDIIPPHCDQLVHFSNSNAILNLPDSHFSMVRFGLSAYQNSFTLTAPVRHIHQIDAHTSVGYDSSYVSDSSTDIAVIGIGYGDGLSSRLSNQGHVVIGHHQCPIIGKVCMDMLMVQLPKNHTVGIHDTAIIISPESSPGMSITTVSSLTDQNPREVISCLLPRVSRVYLSD